MSEQRLKRLEQENHALKLALASHRENAASRSLADKFGQLLRILPAGVVVIDASGIVEQCNPAAQQLLGRSLDGELWREVVRDCFAPQADDGNEISLHDGRRVAIQTKALLDNHGQLVLMTDVTLTRAVQAHQAQSQRLAEMGKMMASLAHQIRTPLSAAMLYSDHLVSKQLEEHQRRKFATKIKNRLENIERQISDMLTFAGGETRHTEVVFVDKLLRVIEDSLDVPLSQYDIDFDITKCEVDVQLKCNLEVLAGAIVSIVINALQACGSEGVIRIVALIVNGSIVISVIDNGPGMDEKGLAQALQAFQTTKPQGTGLGLSIAQQVAKAHDGFFEIKSELGRGTMASFWLPIQDS